MRGPRRHHGPRRHRPWRGTGGRGRPPAGWWLARGIHRTVLAFLLLSLLLGALGGAAIHAGLAQGHAPGALLCAGIAALAAIWPLAWLATFRIAWPLRELAEVAADLRAGRLDRRASLVSTQDEVGEVGAALDAMADRVARQLRDQRALMAAVSHELRSPLARSRVLVEMAREGSAPADVHDALQGEIDQMDRLIGDLLATARIDFEAVSPRALDPGDLARRAVQLTDWEPSVVELEGELDPVNGDPTLVARALAGLLENARRYGGDTVRLRVAPVDNGVRFAVEDDGPGFAPGDEVRAFEPFWRGPGADGEPVPGGAGLGLALVRQIAEAHGGAAGAENRTEGGARVWLVLPLA